MSSTERTVKLSIVIPVYNGEATIARSVKSMLGQDYPNLEKIVIDNCSTDRTLAVLRQYQGKIRIVQNERNLGLAGSYNRALYLAQGDFIAFLQSDCEYGGKDYIRKLLQHFNDPAVGAVTGKSIIPHFHQLKWSQQIFAILNMNYMVDTADTRVQEINFVEARCDLFRKDVLQSIGGFNTQLSFSNEDQDLSIKIRRQGYKLLQDRSQKYILGYGGTQDAYWKLLLKQHYMGRGQGFITYRYRLASTQKASRNTNRLLRMLHRFSQVFTFLALLFLIPLSVTRLISPWFLVSLVIARVVYYGLLDMSYRFQGIKVTMSRLTVLIPTGMLCDVVYGASFLYGMGLSAMRLRV